ncbi:hypothetical protein [Levilactobacillus parabrevis]|uniref:Uncharacterized protein n=1 Tax=Levilactobacillus parabrevis ATCC 53295 TaxID=1267003 RepID=A0A0R1GMN0_9LACO|nr:hypothetical protein [Levilactobacillus parabrevis]KRK35017.1 hypothetical protein FD07_GL001629 [Levilactobacillus parabrevis ATCC 53295]KRO06844.1 hypothetical protein IV61_GL001934 [Levilactobacillus parabrevis]MCT4487799.1 hypothetical protein [Levilactobacillus parabrevis]MCT4490898.1 hypothetical protein [Levilactobacillus parabrevis]
MMQKMPILPLVDRLTAGKSVTLTTSDGLNVLIQPEVAAGRLTGNYVSSALPGIRYDDPRIILKETLTEFDARNVTISSID